MKIKVKYKAIDLRGNQIKLTKGYDCPDFKEETLKHTQKVNGKFHNFEFKKTINEQVMNWLDDMDKMDFIYENDLHCIVDYEIIEAKRKNEYIVKKPTLEELTTMLLGHNERLMVDFAVAYNKLKKSIKKLDIYDQIQITLESLGMAYESKTEAYERMIYLLRSDSVAELAEKIGYNTYPTNIIDNKK